MCDEVECAYAAARIDGNHDRRAGDVGDVREVAARIIAELGIADRQEHQLSDVGEHEVVTVGWELATDCTAIAPPAPARVSTKNCCLKTVVRWSATRRVGTSAVPPAANVLTMRTGRDGHSSAAAAAKRHGGRGEGKPFHGFISEGSIAGRV